MVNWEEIESIEEIEELHGVYDLTVKDNHNFFANSINVHNCGEQGLPKDASCLLSLMNLMGYVKDAYLPSAHFDFETFAKDAQKAQRIMDDLVDLEIECVERIQEKIESDPEPEEEKFIERNLWNKVRTRIEQSRRNGLGLTGLGDCIAAIGIQYGSDESIEEAEKIYGTLGTNSYISTVQMALERGAFPIWDYEKEKDSEFIKMMINSPYGNFPKDKYQQFGRRNIASLTQSPAGSISLVAKLSETRFGTTSGIEPLFQMSHTRRKKINPNDLNARVDFVDEMGDKWTEFKICHSGVEEWKEKTGLSDENESPYFGATANNVDWLKSIEIQSVAQKYIDSGISKTCNLPESATKELVSQCYIEAWKRGAKGFTIYRDGSRSGVLVDSSPKETKNKFNYTDAIKRPKELPCEIHQLTVDGKKYAIFIGLYEGKPFEIFGGESKNVMVPSSVKHGKILKKAKSNYDLQFSEDGYISDIVKAFDDTAYGDLTRMISLSLRHGASPQFVMEQLQKNENTDMFSFGKALARTLKKFVPEGQKISGEECPNCHSKSLAYLEGCKTCLSCQWSKCS